MRQSGAMDKYVAKFQRISMMIHNVSEGRLTFMFLEGLMELLQSMMRVSIPNTLDDAIRVTYDLELIVNYLKKWKTLRGPTIHKGFSGKEGPSKTKSFPQP